MHTKPVYNMSPIVREPICGLPSSLATLQKKHKPAYEATELGYRLYIIYPAHYIYEQDEFHAELSMKIFL